jgi:hypothetical protein
MMMPDAPTIRAPRRRPPYAFEPETMTWSEAAAVACRSTESWLRDHIGDLEGFPRPDPVLQVFSTRAVRAWVERRFGLASEGAAPEDAEKIMLDRLRNGTNVPALPRRPAA